MSARAGLEQVKSWAWMGKEALQVARSTGLSRALGPVTMLRLARDVARGMRGGLTLVHLHALSDPLRPAIVCGENRLSYGELEVEILKLGHALRRLGMGPGERIGAFLRNGAEYIELNAALAVVGGVSVQIGYRLKASEVAYILQNSGARALVFNGDLAPVVDEALSLVGGGSLERSRCIAVGGAPGYASWDELSANEPPTLPPKIEGYGGVMVYTSGTTGRAKGATRDFRQMGYESVLDFVAHLPIRRDERHLVVCPLYHSMAPAFVMMTMAIGGCNVILEHFEPEAVLRTIERERITSSLMVPTMLGRLVALPRETLKKYDLSSLRWLVSGAAPLPTELARRVEETFGRILYNFYGATETGLVTLALPGEHTARPGTIGRAVRGNDIRLLDGEGRPVADGQVGEIYVQNRMLMLGYHGDDAATRAGTKQDHFSVGDLAWRDGDGYFYLAERKSDMVISGGVNIYPWEIEQCLHDHPAVFEAAVVGVPDAEWGESLAAFIVLREGKQATAEELGAFVRDRLADYKRPRRVYFVDALPRNPTGKILKRELRARVAADLAAVRA